MSLSPLGNSNRLSFIRRDRSLSKSAQAPVIAPTENKDLVSSLSSGFSLSSKGLNFEIPANGQAVLGRERESEFFVEDSLVSRKHAVFQMREGRIQVLDPGSRNGTYVNGERIESKRWHNLEVGSHLKMGGLELSLKGPEQLRSGAAMAEQLAEHCAQSAAQVSQAILPGLGGLALRDLKSGQLLPLNQEGPTLLGRAPESHIKIEDLKVSRQHATLQFSEGSLFLLDKASTNGTSLNGERLLPQQWNQIKPGDQLKLGDSYFQLTQALDSKSIDLSSKAELEKVLDFRELIVDPEKQQRKYGELVPDKPSFYWQNNVEARQVFTDYLGRGDFSDAKGFESMLKRSHKLAVEGSAGESRYYKKHDRLMDSEALPGGEFHIGVTGGIRQIESRQVEELAKQYGDPYRADAMDPPKVRLSGLKEQDCPGNMVMLGGQRHIYPQPGAFGDYFGQMRERLEKLEKLPGDAKEEKLQTIGEFYQYGANARPFHNVNNSLFMNFTNALLKRHGFSPVYHGILDHAAHRLQPKAFNEYFRDWAQGAGQIKP